MKKNQNSKKETMDHLKKISEDLESMILGTEIPALQEVVKTDLPSNSTVKMLNLELTKKFADEKAESVVESVVLLYLPKEFVFDQEYIRDKMSVDKMLVSNLIFQMKTAEHAIKRLLEEIDAGGVRDRTFEVLAILQKSKMDIVKHLAQFMIVLENNYKTLRLDYESNRSESTHVQDAEAEEIRNDTMKFRGTKGLMTTLQGYIQEAKQTKTEETEGFAEIKNEPLA
jgi:ribosomal protein S17E